MERDPLVSVIIPAYNCERYLADAIDSVLGQCYRPIEIIVVDDASTDGSAAVARRFPGIRYTDQPHGGIGAARNTGSDLAVGEFLAFIDADDLWVQDKLSRQTAAFEADGSLDVVFGQVQQFVSPELPADVKNRIKCPSDPAPCRLPGAMLIRRRAFFRVGYFSGPIGEVLDWAARASELPLKSAMLPEVVLKRRLHATNSVILHGNPQAEYARYLKAGLDRRRAASARRNA